MVLPLNGASFLIAASAVMPAHGRSKSGVASLAYVTSIHVLMPIQ
jgi:hypothetical protein